MVWLAFSGTGVHVVEAENARAAHERALQLVGEQLVRRGLHAPSEDEVRVRPTSRDELRSLGLA